jgi:hypothetical protein
MDVVAAVLLTVLGIVLGAIYIHSVQQPKSLRMAVTEGNKRVAAIAASAAAAAAAEATATVMEKQALKEKERENAVAAASTGPIGTPINGPPIVGNFQSPWAVKTTMEGVLPYWLENGLPNDWMLNNSDKWWTNVPYYGLVPGINDYFRVPTSVYTANTQFSPMFSTTSINK